jgi:hypothetical protein
MNLTFLTLLVMLICYQKGCAQKPRSSGCVPSDPYCKIDKHEYDPTKGLPDVLPLFDQKIDEEEEGEEEDTRKDYANSDIDVKQIPPGGLMKMSYVTPILRLNASTLFPNVDVKALNKDLLDLTKGVYDRLEKQWGKRACFRKAHCSVNNKFFDWQRSGGWDNYYLKHKSVHVLEDMMFSAADRYTRAMGLGDLRTAVARGESLSEDGEAFTEESQVTALIWATVHKKGIMHHLHDHPFALISGVYYVNVPKGAGDIVLYDPRPQHSHLDSVLTPMPGEFLLFPSWLKHQVQGTVGSDPRISFAFNIDGKWEGTADVGASYELPLRQYEKERFP